MTVLSQYVTQTRRLLHDANSQIWQAPELNDYVNEGRIEVVKDTGCLRSLQSYTVIAATETIDFTALPLGGLALDVLNVSFLNGQSRYPLYYRPWTFFNASLRGIQNYQGTTGAWSIYGQSTIFFGPIPIQNFAAEFDTVITPNTLVDDTTVEQINVTYQQPVKYYAAHLAKMRQQKFAEADDMKARYYSAIQNILNQTFTRRMLSPYVQMPDEDV